jgi:hypothetical protein
MSWTKKAVSLGTLSTLFLAGSVLLNGRPVCAAQAAQAAQQAAKPTAPVEAPLTEKELIKLIKHNKDSLKKVATEVETRGVDFEFTPDIEQKVTKAGATPNLLSYIKQFTPSARATRKSSLGGANVSPQEGVAYNSLKSQRNPDSVIQSAESFAATYPKSPLLTYVYALEASAYQQKNDAANTAKYGEMSLQLDPKNLYSLLMVSSVLAQPVMLNSVSDAQKQERLAKTLKYSQEALDQIDQLPKQPNESDSAYLKRKNRFEAGAYSAIGMVHLERSQMSLEGPDKAELAKAEQSYKSAIAKSDDPNPADYFRLGEAYRGEGKFPDAINAFTKAGQLGQGTVIEQLANQQINNLKQAEASQAKAPAKQ